MNSRLPPGWETSDGICDMCGRRKKDHPTWQDESTDCAERGFWGDPQDLDYIPPVEQS